MPVKSGWEVHIDSNRKILWTHLTFFGIGTLVGDNDQSVCVVSDELTYLEIFGASCHLQNNDQVILE